MNFKIHIGMRKIKSLLAVALSFFVWQAIRFFLPMIEPHPIFAYVYSIVDMRADASQTQSFGRQRIKATLIGLVMGLIFIALSVFVGSKIENENLRIFVEFVFILLAVLSSLCVAEMLGCKNFCGVAAYISVIYMVLHSGDDIFLYAIMCTL